MSEEKTTRDTTRVSIDGCGCALLLVVLIGAFALTAPQWIAVIHALQGR